MIKNLIYSFLGAITFYTTISLPSSLPRNFGRIAMWLPWVGIILGGLLSLIFCLLKVIGFPGMITAILLVASAIYLTGGLHLDGVIDSADGLALQSSDGEKRLAVMADSRTGAFGVMAGIVLISLKWSALYTLQSHAWWALMLAMSWARWGQLMAIVFYDYLKKEGKGAFLKDNLLLPSDFIGASLFVFPMVLVEYLGAAQSWLYILLVNLGCCFISLLIGWWFNKSLGGHTGDTYGATVEWSEALILCCLTIGL